MVHFRRFFAGFSKYIINFAGKISEAAMGGAGGAELVNEPKKTGARSALGRPCNQTTLVSK